VAKFVKIADSAMEKPYAEVQETQGILRPLEVSSKRAGTARWAYAYALQTLSNIGDIIVPDNAVQADQVNEAIQRLVSAVRARSLASAQELRRRGMVRQSTDIGAAALDRRAASDAISAFRHASKEARQTEQVQLDSLLQTAGEELQRQKTVKRHLADTLQALSNDGHPMPLDAIQHCEKALHSEVTACGGGTAAGLSALCKAPIGAAAYDIAVELLREAVGVTPEFLALLQMHVVCTSWALGDTYMRNCKESRSSKRESFASLEGAETAVGAVDQVSVLDRIDGEKALISYQKSEVANRCLELQHSSEDYDGPRTALSADVLALLGHCIQGSHDEITRKDKFNELVRTGESDLAAHKASLALKGQQASHDPESAERSQPDDVSTSTGFLGAARIAANEDERRVAQDCIARAERELERQKRVKSYFADAIKALDDNDGRHTTVKAITCCEEALLAEAPRDTETYGILSSVRESTDMSVYAMDADDHQQCWDKLLEKEGAGGASDCTARRQGWKQLHAQSLQQLTPEHRALLALHMCCVEWARGDMFLRTWEREKGDAAYKKSLQAAQAAEIDMTEGYFGPQLRLSDALRQLLDKNIQRAEAAIEDQRKFKALREEAAHLFHTESKSGSAAQVSGRMSNYARSPAEIAQQRKEGEMYETNLARQRRVKQCHESAVLALTDNDPDAASEHYTRALGDETEDTPERQALEHLNQMCISWKKGNVGLDEWHGLDARIAFKRCEELVKDTNILQPTNEYAFTLGSREFQIKLCDEYESAFQALRDRISIADIEIQRKDRFEELLRDGNEKLVVHQAKFALEVFGTARGVAKFGQYDGRQAPAEAEKEWAQCAECFDRAEAELGRQKTVKSHLADTLQALSNDGYPMPLDAIQHCEKALHSEVTACGGADTPAAIGLTELCKVPLNTMAAYDKAVELLREAVGVTPEFLALLQMHVVCTSWALGDTYMRNSKQRQSLQRESFKILEGAELPTETPIDAVVQASVLDRIDGEKALISYQKSELAAQNAADVEVTKGYADNSGEAGADMLARDSICFTPHTRKELQRCLELATDEIERKEEFNEYIKTGEEHLINRRANRARDEHFNLAEQKSINEDETDAAQACIKRATAELERQQRVKAKFIQAIHFLENDSAPKAEECIQEALEDEGCVRWAGTPNQEPLPEHLLGEHNALQHLLGACQSWIEGDKHLNAWNGQDAQLAFKKCVAAAHKATQQAGTEGYDGGKLELSPNGHKELLRRLQQAADEIIRRAEFETRLHAGTDVWSVNSDGLVQQKEQLGQLPEVELKQRARLAGVAQEVLDEAAHSDDQKSTLVGLLLFGKNDRCPAHLIQTQRRGDGVVALQDCKHLVAERVESDGTADVHAVMAFESHYLVTYQNAKCRRELDAVVQEMYDACTRLRCLLQEERDAHEQRADDAQVYFNGCEIGGTSLFELLHSSIKWEKELEMTIDKRQRCKTAKAFPDIDAEIAEIQAKLDECHRQFASLNSDGLRASSLIRALRSVAEWSVDKDLTAKHLDERVDVALSTLTTMEDLNEEIRDSAAKYAPKSTGLDTFEEGDEEESSDDDAQAATPGDSRAGSHSMDRTESSRLDLLIDERNGQRRRFIEYGDVFIHAQQQLLPLRAQQQEFLKEIGAALLHIRRQRRSLLHSGKALRIFQMQAAGASVAAMNQDGTPPKSWNHILENGTIFCCSSSSNFRFSVARNFLI
jgi:hypothetical protein